MEPGDTPADNTNFLFFCSAVIQAVNKHQGLLRASVANIGQDHRLGANEAPPAIISIFLGAELEKAFESIASGSGDGNTGGDVLELGSDVLPHLPMHGGDRNRTSPFAFTGNKFEFRALGSSMSLGFPNTVLNTIVAEAIDDLADQLEAKLNGGGDISGGGCRGRRVDSYSAQQADHLRRRQLHRRVARRGREPRAQEPAHDARRAARGDRGADRRGVRQVPRPLRARAPLALRGVARAVRHSREHRGGDDGVDRPHDDPAGGPPPPGADRRGRRLVALDGHPGAARHVSSSALDGLSEANGYPDGVEGLELAEYARDHQLAAMATVREAADALESVVADDLWPLPKYSEILFIK